MPDVHTPVPRSQAERDVLATEFCERYIDLMRNRMIISYFKYGALAAAYPDKVDALASLRTRLARYAETGNAEWLVDAANFAMIEFMRPRHGTAHFRATTADESPGRSRDDGGEACGSHRWHDTALERLQQRYLRPEP